MGIGWAAWLLLGFAACGTDEVPSFDETVILDESELPSALSEAQCEAQMDCDCLTVAGPVGEDPAAHTLSQCKEHRRLEIEFWQKGAQYHGLTYDPACLARRLAAMNEIGCGGVAVWNGMQAETGCADRCRIYHGDLAEGADCDREDDVDRCGQGLFCDWGWDETTEEYAGTCKKACVDDGESCLFSSCAPSSQCIEWVCQPSPQVGDPCPEYWCLDGYCNPDILVCEPYQSPGDDCSIKPGGCPGGCANGVCLPSIPTVCGWDFRQPYAQYY
jgi:hypothetical protein